MGNSDMRVGPVVFDYTESLALEERVGQIRSMINVVLPREAKIEEKFDSYAIIFGNYPLGRRRVIELKEHLDEAFNTPIRIGIDSFRSAAIPPDRIPSRISYNPNRDASHYNMLVNSYNGKEQFLVKIAPFDMIFHSRGRVKSIDSKLINAHEIISDLGMADSETYILPSAVVGVLKGTESSLYAHKGDAWNVIRHYCDHMGIRHSLVPPDLSRYN